MSCVWCCCSGPAIRGQHHTKRPTVNSSVTSRVYLSGQGVSCDKLLRSQHLGARRSFPRDRTPSFSYRKTSHKVSRRPACLFYTTPNTRRSVKPPVHLSSDMSPSHVPTCRANISPVNGLGALLTDLVTRSNHGNLESGGLRRYSLEVLHSISPKTSKQRR